MPGPRLPINASLKGRYTIRHDLGGGQYSAVYLARDILSNDDVVVKQNFAGEEELQDQFRREAQLLYQLSHRALPKTLDYFIEGASQFLVMTYISGRTLSEVLTGQRLSVDHVLGWAAQLLDALEYLHNQPDPVVHRDIKPSNIRLDQAGNVYLIDFGLAKGNLASVTPVAQGNTVLGGTPLYAPLEQILKYDVDIRYMLDHFMSAEEREELLDAPSDARADIYSLGATLYHLLTGVKPAISFSRFSSIKNKGPNHLRPPHELRPEIPVHVSTGLLKAMAIRPKYRHPNIASMREALFQGDEVETVTRAKRVKEPKAVLRWTDSSGERVTYRLNAEETLIGREEGQIQFPGDMMMSARHARIRHDGTEYHIFDAQSRNGIYKRILGDIELSDNDEIQIHNLRFKVCYPSSGGIELHHLKGEEIDHVYRFNEPETIIGTGTGMFRFNAHNDRNLEAPQARLMQRGEKFALLDSSVRGSNFKKIQGSAQLSDGDLLLLGVKLFRFELSDQ